MLGLMHGGGPERGVRPPWGVYGGRSWGTGTSEAFPCHAFLTSQGLFWAVLGPGDEVGAAADWVGCAVDSMYRSATLFPLPHLATLPAGPCPCAPQVRLVGSFDSWTRGVELSAPEVDTDGAWAQGQ